MGKSFGYYGIHSEDLVNTDLGVRYAALVNLAAWVGSGKKIQIQVQIHFLYRKRMEDIYFKKFSVTENHDHYQ